MKWEMISFILNFSESMIINSQIGTTIKAGNHFDKIAAPMLTPARRLKTDFFLCANKMLNTTAN